jgi:hypothetical protein
VEPDLENAPRFLGLIWTWPHRHLPENYVFLTISCRDLLPKALPGKTSAPPQQQTDASQKNKKGIELH